MGFFGNIISAIVKAALTPIAIVADVVTIVIQKPDQATHTKELLNSAGKDAEKAIDDIT